MKLNKIFPIIDSFTTHDSGKWRNDFIAGLTVAVMLVPQGMAYALLAGMPPIYGLYGGLIPLLLYAIFGTSRQMSIGPVAISALLVLAGVSQIAEPFSTEYISLVVFTGLLVGVAQVVLSLFRLGFLVNFISHPVIIGFTSAAAIIIAVSQLKALLGFEIPRFAHVYETLKYAGQHLGETNFTAVIMCLGSIITMVVLRKVSRAIPGALLVVVVGALLVYFLGEETLSISIIREVPDGLPAFQLPEMSWERMNILLPTVFTVTIICIVESIAIAKVLQAKHGDYAIRPDQELFALGISKIGGAFFQSIPTSGSFTRSAVNNEAGAASGFASIVTAIVIGLTLLFLTPLFFYVPKCVLAAIILLSVKSLFEFEQAIDLWYTHRSDFFMMLTTFLVTLVLGIEQGVFAGVLLSVVMILYRSSKPHIAVLGKIPNSTSYRNIKRHKKAEEIEGILIVRFDDQLYFANATYFQDKIMELVAQKKGNVKALLLKASSIHSIDSTGIHALEETYEQLKKRDIIFYISGMVGPVRDQITKIGLMKKLGLKSQYLSVHSAVEDLKNRDTKAGQQWLPEALQSNERDQLSR
ncbi:MAG: SulP family inorganic anion transporter [Saprospiraceae bacterium]